VERCFKNFLLDDVGFNVLVVGGWGCWFGDSVREEVDFTDDFAVVFVVLDRRTAKVDGESEEREHGVAGKFGERSGRLFGRK